MSWQCSLQYAIAEKIDHGLCCGTSPSAFLIEDSLRKMCGFCINLVTKTVGVQLLRFLLISSSLSPVLETKQNKKKAESLKVQE